MVHAGKDSGYNFWIWVMLNEKEMDFLLVEQWRQHNIQALAWSLITAFSQI